MSVTFTPKKAGRKGSNVEGFVQAFLSRQRERELPLILKLQGLRNKFWDWYFFSASVLGEEVFFITFVPFCSWNLSRQVALHLTCLLALTVGGGNMLKNFLQSPRPPPKIVWVNRSSPEHDPGFPSTHTMTAFAIPWYLIVFYWGTMTTPTMFLGLVLLVWWSFSIAVSRVYNGHHFIVDVLGGFALAIVILSVWTHHLRYVIDYVALETGLIGPVTLVGLALGLLYLHPQAVHPNPAAAETGLVFGTCSGTFIAAWLQHYAPISTGLGYQFADATVIIPGEVALMTARFIIGVVVVGLARELSKLVYLPIILSCYSHFKLRKVPYDRTNYKHSEVDVILKYLTYTSVSFSVVYIVPHVCGMLNLFHASDFAVFVK